MSEKIGDFPPPPPIMLGPIRHFTNFLIKIESRKFRIYFKWKRYGKIRHGSHFNYLEIMLRLILGRNHTAKLILGGRLIFHENTYLDFCKNVHKVLLTFINLYVPLGIRNYSRSTIIGVNLCKGPSK